MAGPDDSAEARAHSGVSPIVSGTGRLEPTFLRLQPLRPHQAERLARLARFKTATASSIVLTSPASMAPSRAR
jgi:hypothetical protein